ncbi:FtsJ methyltransferase domain-containing protein 2, partial [Rhizopus stolonifer]
MDDLYSDNDPDYRATLVRSGIPPPSLRDQRRQQQRNNDLSRYNPSLQRQAHHRYSPYEHHDQARQDKRHHATNQQYRSQYGSQNASNYPAQDMYHDRSRQPYPQHAEQRPPSQQRAPPLSYNQAAPVKPKPLDMRTSTDFLKCEKRLSVDSLVSVIKKNASEIDYEFLSSKGLVDRVNQLREKIRHVSAEQRSRARSKSNPFERIGDSIFMNRAATKMAALDATFGLTVTENSRDEFTFADICGGPGGFSEYLLWRVHSWGSSAHGFGITLKGDEEVNWHTEKFREDIPRHSLTTVDGPDGTGDLYKQENIRAFESAVLKETGGKGVFLAVADGGFDFSGNEGQQETLVQQLLLCEIITMLCTLKKGGHFVCKFFDMLSTCTASLVWLLYQLFDEICITKPLSSRPANAERYVVCKGLLYDHPTALVSTLLDMNKDTTCPSLFSRDILEKDEDFIDYIKMRNMKFAMKQTEALERLIFFIENPDAAPLYDQEQIKRTCLN